MNDNDNDNDHIVYTLFPQWNLFITLYQYITQVFVTATSERLTITCMETIEGLTEEHIVLHTDASVRNERKG